MIDLEMPVMEGRAFRLTPLQMPPHLRSIPVIVLQRHRCGEQLTAELRPFACLSKPLSNFSPLTGQVEAHPLSA